MNGAGRPTEIGGAARGQGRPGHLMRRGRTDERLRAVSPTPAERASRAGVWMTIPPCVKRSLARQWWELRHGSLHAGDHAEAKSARDAVTAVAWVQTVGPSAALLAGGRQSAIFHCLGNFGSMILSDKKRSMPEGLHEVAVRVCRFIFDQFMGDQQREMVLARAIIDGEISLRNYLSLIGALDAVLAREGEGGRYRRVWPHRFQAAFQERQRP